MKTKPRNYRNNNTSETIDVSKVSKPIVGRHVGDKFIEIEPKSEALIAWDFVENHYPNYSSCDDIAKFNDLDKLLSDEHEDGDDADKLLWSEYEGYLGHTMISVDHCNLLIKIYEKTITEFKNKHDEK